MSIDKGELHRRIMLVREQLQAGKIKFAPHLVDNFWQSFSKIKYGPDGLVDPDTVDSRVRSMAMMISHFDGRNKMKQAISLREIQFAYFEFIEANFGSIYQIMMKNNLTPYNFAKVYSKDIERSKDLTKSIPDFFSALNEFWEKTAEYTSVHLEDLTCFKVAYGGDLFPTYTQNIASSVGLYVDTIILPDPFLRIIPMFKVWTEEQLAFYTLKLALNLLSYRPLALAQLDVPIVAILPDKFGMSDDHTQFIEKIGKLDAVKHCSSLFGRQFESVEEIYDYVRDLKSEDDLVKALAAPEKLLFDSEWIEPKSAQIRKFHAEHYNKIIPDFHAGNLTVLNSISRMSQANDILMKSRELRGTPILDAPTSWQYLSWKYEYDATDSSQGSLHNLFMIKGLQEASSGKMKWLGKIPPKTLVDLRRTGTAQEIRELLTRGMKKIESLDPHDFEKAGDFVVNEIRTAFSDHNRKVDQLREQKNEFFKDAAKWVTIGALEVTAIAKGIPSYGLLAFAANQIIEVPKLKDLPSKIQNLKQQTKTVVSSPAAILANIKSDIESKE